MPHSIPGPDDIFRTTLPNGITVLARPNFQSQSVVLSGYLQVGSLTDPDDKLGQALFTAGMLLRGTAQHTFDALYDLLESNGARLAFRGHTHTTGFNGRALAEDLPLLLHLLSEALQTPTFPPEEVENLRAQWLTSLALREQDTAEMAELAFDRLVYREHPYGRPDDGYPETIQALTRDDLRDFHQTWYGPRGMVVAVVGAIAPQAAAEAVAQALGDWRNPRQPPPPTLPPLRPLTETARAQVAVPGKSQCDVVVGAAGPARPSPDYLPAMLGNTILGRFGLMGRIGDAVREQAGLAYYAYSELHGGYGPAPWEVRAGVAPEHAPQALDLILAELRRFTREPVTEEELADARAGILGSLPLSFESNQGVASALLTMERYDLGLDYYRRFADLVRAVSRAEILHTAQRYLDPARLAIAVAGDLPPQADHGHH